MTRSSAFESLVGLFVVAAAAVFLVYGFNAAGRTTGGDYELTAVFGRVSGVAAGTEVRIAGIKIGSVTQTRLDPLTYEANVTLAIGDGVGIPSDSVAKVSSDGLLGGAHISIEPGASEDMLGDGDRILLTQGSVDVLGLAVQAFTAGAGAGGEDAPPPGGGLE